MLKQIFIPDFEVNIGSLPGGWCGYLGWRWWRAELKQYFWEERDIKRYNDCKEMEYKEEQKA